MVSHHGNSLSRPGALWRKLGARAVFGLALLLGALGLAAQERQTAAPAMVLEFDGARQPGFGGLHHARAVGCDGA